jgi:hypothetical protein
MRALDEKGIANDVQVGSVREFADWTRHVPRDPAVTDHAATKCFDSEEAARQATVDHVSADAVEGPR